MFSFKEINRVSLRLAGDVLSHLGPIHSLNRHQALNIADNPTVETENDVLWLWINIGNIAHYRFGYVRVNFHFELKEIQRLDLDMKTWHPFK